MAGKEPNGGKFVQYGTILEIRDAVSLEDGRIILTTVGLKRYRIISRGEQVNIFYATCKNSSLMSLIFLLGWL